MWKESVIADCCCARQRLMSQIKNCFELAKTCTMGSRHDLFVRQRSHGGSFESVTTLPGPISAGHGGTFHSFA